MPPSKDQPSWVWVLDRFGLPTLAVIAMGYAIWTVATWFGPKADLLIDTHLKSIAKLVDVSQAQERTLSEIADRGDARDRKIDEIHRAVVPAGKSLASPPPNIGPLP